MPGLDRRPRAKRPVPEFDQNVARAGLLDIFGENALDIGIDVVCGASVDDQYRPRGAIAR